MSFIEEFVRRMKEDGFPFPPEYRWYVYGDYAVYIENASGIIEYTQDKIGVALKKAELTVKGQNLYVKSFCEGDLVICGKIVSVEKS